MERDKLICLDVSKSPNTREPALNTRATQDIKGKLRFLNVILPSQRDMSELQWYSQSFVYDQEFKKKCFLVLKLIIFKCWVFFSSYFCCNRDNEGICHLWFKKHLLHKWLDINL